MKKATDVNILLHKKRTRKKILRKRKEKRYLRDRSTFSKTHRLQIAYERKVIDNHKSKLLEFLIEKKFIVGTEDSSEKIEIGERFSLEKNYDETIKKISDIIFSIWQNAGKELVIDFSNCNEVDQSALFLLQILRLEFQSELFKLNERLSILETSVKITFIPSENKAVNLHLLLCGLISKVDVEKDIVPIDSLGYLKGSKQQKAYLENKKGYNASRIVSYVDQCLVRNGFELNEIGRNEITNLIGEVLNNAEDHSPFTTYYVTANYHHENDCTPNSGTVGELNLSFLNFGYSIFEGLVENKDENAETYSWLNDAYKTVSQKAPVSKDNIFTLYALQDGISRLKYEDESRGTGTMKFIRCFFAIGDYEDKLKGKLPHLSILSGKTRLVCDKQYEPFFRENRYFVSLNDEQNLLEPPKKTHLKELTYSFPGTLLSVKVYLNNEHINSKFATNGS